LYLPDTLIFCCILSLVTTAYVLLLDIVGSSNLRDREAATLRMQAAQKTVNERFPKAWLAPLETTRGDETAAVLRQPADAYDIIAALGDEIHPLSVRAVLKRGELVAGLDTRRASIIDGPAFHIADELMESIKGGPAQCLFDTGLSALDRPLTALGNLLLSQLAGLTELQRRILRLYQENRKQKTVAEIIGRSQQQVSSALQAIRWELLDDAEAVMRELLAEVETRQATRDPGR
jgi:hypothetical protein